MSLIDSLVETPTSTKVVWINTLPALITVVWVRFFLPTFPGPEASIFFAFVVVPVVLLSYFMTLVLFGIVVGSRLVESRRMAETNKRWNYLLHTFHLALVVFLPYCYYVLIASKLNGH